MRKYVLFFLVLIFLLAGCQSKEEKLQKQLEIQQKQIQTQISDLKTQAITYEQKADFDNAVALYEKALNLKEDSEIRNKLTDIKIEKESIDKTKAFLMVVKDIQYKLDTISNMVDLSNLLIENKRVFDEFESVDTTKNTAISNFVGDILKSDNYKNFKTYYDDEYIKQAELDSRTNKTLDKLSGGIAFSLINNMMYDSIKSMTKMYLGSLPKELPAKYRK